MAPMVSKLDSVAHTSDNKITIDEDHEVEFHNFWFRLTKICIMPMALMM